jgi:hypothetical protein
LNLRSETDVAIKEISIDIRLLHHGETTDPRELQTSIKKTRMDIAHAPTSIKAQQG